MCQSPYRNVIRACRREFSDIREIDASRHFNDGSAFDQAHGLMNEIRGHVVEQEDVSLSLKGLYNGIERFDFHAYPESMRRVRSCQTARLSNVHAPGLEKGQMIVFDQDAIVQGHPMVLSSAQGDRPFFESPKARCRFSGVQDFRGIWTNGLAKLFRESRDA